MENNAVNETIEKNELAQENETVATVETVEAAAENVPERGAGNMKSACDKIRTYLDNMFASLPATAQAFQLKEDMYCSMLDKYNSLIAGGAGEDEAFGRVVGEFGSVEDIRAELDDGGSVENYRFETAPQAAESGEYVATAAPEITKAYEKYKIIKSVLIAAAVILFILAPLGWNTYLEWVGDSKAADLVFGTLIAVGVLLCVTSVTGEEKFFDVVRKVRYSAIPEAERVTAYRKFAGVRSWLMGTAVALFVEAPFVSDLLDSDILMGVFVAVGVAILIVIGAVRDTYKDVLGKKKKES